MGNQEGMAWTELITYKREIESQLKQQKKRYKHITNKVQERRRGYKNTIDKNQRSRPEEWIEGLFHKISNIDSNIRTSFLFF